MITCPVCYVPVGDQLYTEHQRFHKANNQHRPDCFALATPPVRIVTDPEHPETVKQVPGDPNPCTCPLAYIS